MGKTGETSSSSFSYSQVQQCYPRRWDGARKDHPDHLFPVLPVSPASAVWTFPTGGASVHTHLLAEGIWHLGPRHECGGLSRWCHEQEDGRLGLQRFSLQVCWAFRHLQISVFAFVLYRSVTTSGWTIKQKESVLMRYWLLMRFYLKIRLVQ